MLKHVYYLFYVIWVLGATLHVNKDTTNEKKKKERERLLLQSGWGD